MNSSTAAMRAPPVDADRADRQRGPQMEAERGVDAFQRAGVGARPGRRRAPPRPAGREPHVPRRPRRPRGARAAASAIATWPSWPQACMRPFSSERVGRPVSSSRGSASMSARNIRRLPSVPQSARTPVVATPVRGARPSSARRPATSAAVRRSSNASSGCRCRSRRVATRRSYSPEGKSESSRSRCGTAGL